MSMSEPDSAESKPVVAPSLPPVPKAKPSGPAVLPVWWRGGKALAVVVLLVALTGELIAPGTADGWTLGLGSAIGTLAFVAAYLLLRRDLSRGERLFIVLLGLFSALAQFSCGSGPALFIALASLFLLQFLPTAYPIDRWARYQSWWTALSLLFGAEKAKIKGRGPAFMHGLAVVVSVLIGLAAFAFFMAIFAAENPVVKLVSDALCRWVDALVAKLHLSWDIVVHAIWWLAALLLFGLWTLMRPRLTAEPAGEPAASRPLLPHLPLMTLLGVNAAFLICNTTDVMYLWQNKVPDGVSLTTYLHDGAESVMWASALAAALLILLFRYRGSARSSKASTVAGYALALQTLLLASSVLLRLYHQISDFGFTATRIVAGETLLLGLALMVVLLCYMVRQGLFFRHLKLGAGVTVLLFTLFCVQAPEELAAELNYRLYPSHPNWKHNCHDFYTLSRNMELNLTRAYQLQRVASNHCSDDAQQLRRAADAVQKRADYPYWTNLTLSLLRDRAVVQPVREYCEALDRHWQQLEEQCEKQEEGAPVQPDPQ